MQEEWHLRGAGSEWISLTRVAYPTLGGKWMSL